MNDHYTTRPAMIDDAQALAELVNIAGEGMPLYLWTQMADDESSPWKVGLQRAKRDSGGFSYTHAYVMEDKHNVVSCLIGYPIYDKASVEDYHTMPDMFVPLQRLEDQVTGSWYINVLATHSDYRDQGLGSELIKQAERFANKLALSSLSLIVADQNTAAIRLYERHGFITIAREDMIKDGWQNPSEQWILMSKQI